MWTPDYTTIDPFSTILFATILLLCVLFNGMLLAFTIHILFQARSAPSTSESSYSGAGVSALFFGSFFNGFIGPLLTLIYVICSFVAYRPIGGLDFCSHYMAPIFVLTTMTHGLNVIIISTLRWLSIVKNRPVSNRRTVSLFIGAWLWHIVLATILSNIPGELTSVDRHAILCGLRGDGEQSPGGMYCMLMTITGIPWVSRCNIAISKQVKAITMKAKSISEADKHRLLLQVQASSAYMTLSFCFFISGVLVSLLYIIIRKNAANTVDTWAQYAIVYSLMIFQLDIAIKPIIVLVTVRQFRRYLYNLCGIIIGQEGSMYTVDNMSMHSGMHEHTTNAPNARSPSHFRGSVSGAGGGGAEKGGPAGGHTRGNSIASPTSTNRASFASSPKHSLPDNNNNNINNNNRELEQKDGERIGSVSVSMHMRSGSGADRRGSQPIMVSVKPCATPSTRRSSSRIAPMPPQLMLPDEGKGVDISRPSVLPVNEENGKVKSDGSPIIVVPASPQASSVRL